jgi:hypothetical protein
MAIKTNPASDATRLASGATAPLKVVLLLACAVLLAHLALLSQNTAPLGLRQPPAREVFSTRLIVPAAPTMPTARATPQTPPAPALAAPRATAVIEAPATQKQETASATDTPTPTATPTSTVAETAPNEPTLAPTLAQNKPQEAPQEAASAPAPAPAPAVTAPAPDPLPQANAWVPTYNVPASVRLKYLVQANKFPFSVNAELAWQTDAQTYDARLTISAFGQARTQTSRGQITAQGLAPLRFSDKYRSEVAAHFNRETGKVTFSANTPDVLLSPGAQDRLSILLQLGAMAAGSPAQFTEGTTLAVQTVGPRDADTWLLTVQGEEPLVLPGGAQTGLKLLRKPRKEFDQRVEVWLGKDMAYLPIRLKITETNGDYLDLKWLSSEKIP